jgi:hypothetical protein
VTGIVHPDIERPESVTHFLCLLGAELTGDELTTHHIDGLGRCKYCRQSLGWLRKELGLA